MSHIEEGAGLYIHFPFCTKLCHYCDFNVYSVPDIPQQDYTDAVIKELQSRGYLLGDRVIHSIFLGGGTPSLWETAQVKRVLDVVKNEFSLSNDVEISVEMNPNETSPKILDGFREAGCNRVSLGIQSLRDDLLKNMARRHSAKQAIEALIWIGKAGFKSFSGDLIFGLPGQTLAMWTEDLQQVLEMGVPHLSTYNLMVEHGTPLYLQVKRGKVTLPEDQLQVEMLTEGRRLIRQKGLSPYEISNSSIKGHESVHNEVYWSGAAYLGIGAGSHGFLPESGGGKRQANIRKFTHYMKAINEKGTAIHDEEAVDASTHAIELMMTGLRRTNGVDISEVAQQTRHNRDTLFHEEIQELLEEGLLARTASRLVIPEEHIPVSDSIFLRFF